MHRYAGTGLRSAWRARPGLAHRARLFQYTGSRQYGTQMGMTEMAFRLAAACRQRCSAGAKAFAELVQSASPTSRCASKNDGETCSGTSSAVPCAGNGKRDEPVCHLAVGLLQEALYWLSGGKVFNVEEKTCIAAAMKMHDRDRPVPIFDSSLTKM
ncbi:MAG: hypothetical protein MZV64_19670 [Ignavibacteriales bacterium]|nr:hypothetical protein [Ignavibacteriales bacterium]